MMEFMTLKQALGEEILRAHDQFIPLHHLAIRLRDRVLREECIKEEGIFTIKKAIAAMHTLFE